MAKPKRISTLYIDTSKTSTHVIKVYMGKVKAGNKYTFEVVPPLRDVDGDVLATEISNINGVRDAIYRSNEIELFLERSLDWDRIRIEIQELIIEMYNVRVAPSLMPQATSQSTSSQPNVGGKINGIVIKGTYSGDLIEVVGVSRIGIDEKDYDYEVIINGQKGYLPRNNFMVEGDSIGIKFNGKSPIEAKILVLKNNTTIKIDSKTTGIENWNIGGFDWGNSKIEIDEYNNLHEVFDSKVMPQSTQPNIGGKVYGIIFLGFTPQVVEVISQDRTSGVLYRVVLENGTTVVADRATFFVEGDEVIFNKSFIGRAVIEKIRPNGIIDTITPNNPIGNYKDIEIVSGIKQGVQPQVTKFYDLKLALSQNAAPSTQPIATTQPNTGGKVYAVVIKEEHAGKMIEIHSIAAKYASESYYEYNTVIDGKKLTISRDSFMVEGDIVNYQSQVDYKILEIKNSTTIGVLNLTNNIEWAWNIGGVSWKNEPVDIVEYYQLHEIFDSKAMSQASPKTTSQKPKKTLSEDEERIDKLNREISELIAIKGSLQPFEVEDIIKIEQKIDTKQKGVNEITVQIVDKKLANNKIFDDLFEQSFLPIEHRYNNVFLSDESQFSGNFFAPNGDASKLDDALNIFIRTKLFKDWFGDWQLAYQYRDIPNSGIYCSKVVNDNYEPRIVWHGTGREFSYFRFDKFPAAYFAVNKEYSEFFANIQSQDNEEGYVIPFFLNLRKPLDLTKFGVREITPKDFFDYIYLETGMTMDFLEVNPIFLDPQMRPLQTWMYIRNNPKMLLKLAESHVYDGIHFYETNPGIAEGRPDHMTEAYITFKPESCKIAAPNRGDIILASMKSFLLEKGGKI